MVSALVVFDPKYRNARLVAEEIARGLESTGRLTATVTRPIDRSGLDVAGYDIIVIGSHDHRGSAAQQVVAFFHRLPRGSLARKAVSVFDVMGPRQGVGRARELQRAFERQDPPVHLVSPGISVAVDGLSGTVPDRELPKCREFGEWLGRTSFYGR